MDRSDTKEVEAEFPPYFTLYKDGSLRRHTERLLPPLPELAQADGVASRDVTFNTDLGLWARIFLPASSSSRKLPIILYFHGGGFIFGSPALSYVHYLCSDMALRSSAICVSVNYRLAPEHRLPAAIDDGFMALQWLHSQCLLQAEGKEELMDEIWLAMADFSKCFCGGDSAGGNIAHHVVMKAMNKPLGSESWKPLCITGLILIHPFFMRATRTQEELDCNLMSWELANMRLGLSLPPGSSKESPYFNPFHGMSSAFVLPRTLVALADKDALHFMGLEYVRALTEAGCKVDVEMSRGVGHGFFVEEPHSEQAIALMERIDRFITEEA